MSARVIPIRTRPLEPIRGYQAGPNWPLIVVLALSIGIWTAGGVMVWWLI